MSQTMFSRIAPRPIAALAALAVVVPATAQLVPGNIVVSTQAGTPAVYGYTVITAPGVSFPLLNLPATITQDALTAFEVDPVSGDILHAFVGPAGIELRRMTIAGAAAATDTLLTTIPNTVGYRPSYLHREPTGGYLLLSRTAILGAGPQLLHRIGVTSQSAVSYLVSQIPGSLLYTDLAVNPVNNDIQLAGPNGTTATAVATMSFNGANWNAVSWLSNQVRAWSLEVSDIGQSLIAGVNYTIGIGPNFHCQSSGFAINFAVGQSCVDLHAERNLGTMLAVFNGGGSTVDRYSLGCSPAWQAQLFAAPAMTALFKVSPFAPSPAYGYPRETLSGAVPFADVIGQPMIGGAWVVQATNVVGANAIPFAFFTMGFDDVSSGGAPLPIDLTPAGYDRCALFCNAAATVLLPVTGGTAMQIVPIPNSPGYIGLGLFGQWAAVDGATAVQSNAVRSTVL